MTERALVGAATGCAALSVALTNQRYGDAPTVTWTATIAPNATEMKRPLTAVGTGSRWDEEIGRFVPDTERAAVRRALEAQAALNAPDATWAGHAVPYLLGQPPFVSPLSGGLSVAGFNKVVSECQVVREGSARDYDSAIHFGKRELAAMQDEGARTGAPLQRAVGGALLGVGADVDSAVKAWLKVLPSGQISDEESGRVDTTSGRWDTTGERHRPQGLFFCWPKHLQWKGEAPNGGYERHNHHVWPKWIGGGQSETLPMSAHFHNRLFHSGAFEAKLAERIAARDKKYRDLRRTADSAQGLYERLEEQTEEARFMEFCFQELRLLYQEFADAHVAIGRSEFLIEVEQILAQVRSTGPSW